MTSFSSTLSHKHHLFTLLHSSLLIAGRKTLARIRTITLATKAGLMKCRVQIDEFVLRLAVFCLGMRLQHLSLSPCVMTSNNRGRGGEHSTIFLPPSSQQRHLWVGSSHQLAAPLWFWLWIRDLHRNRITNCII